MRDRAVELGVEVRQPCRALHPIVTQNRVTGIATNQGKIKAKFAVDATGNRQWLAKQLKLAINPFSPPLIAHYGYAEGDCPIRDDAPAIVAGDGDGFGPPKAAPNLTRDPPRFPPQTPRKKRATPRIQNPKTLGKTRRCRCHLETSFSPRKTRLFSRGRCRNGSLPSLISWGPQSSHVRNDGRPFNDPTLARESR